MVTVTPEQAQTVFLRLMAKGWAAGEKPATHPEFPGRKFLRGVDGDFLLIDTWTQHEPECDASSGSTTLLFQRVPIWVMQYGGWYGVEGSALVQRALARNYENGVFNGGRGPDIYRSGSLVYENTVLKPDFTDFTGQERVLDGNSRTFHGQHQYFGQWLLRRNGKPVTNVPRDIEPIVGTL